MRPIAHIAAAALGLVAALVGAGAAPAQAELSAVRVAAGLASPMYVAAPPGDPRLFVVEREGRIRVLSGGVVIPTPALAIEERVCTTSEGGLLGLAFAPDFAASGHFYVYYTAPRTAGPPCSLESRVSRFTMTGNPAESNDADEASEVILFRIDQPYDNHNGGTIAIRDGWLYLALGDGGDAGDPQDRAQDDGSLFGKMLRFDLSDAAVPWTPEVWAKGLRNPFRFSFDRATGDLYLGDVGQSAWEEIDAERADSPGGRNYGWDVHEGSNDDGTGCFDPDPGRGEPPCNDPSLIDPIFEYEHFGNCGGAVTGGAVYRGSASPALQGLYFFADYCKSRIWSLRWNRDTNAVSELDERTGEIATDAGTISSVVAIGEDAAGELYFVDPGGELFRLVPEPDAGAAAAALALALAATRARRRVTGPWRRGC